MQKSSRLAILALIELAANPDRQISTAEIGEKYRVSAHHLAKVLLVLGRAGLVRSVRGVGGGYVFLGNARRVTLYDIISMFEETEVTCRLDDPSQASPEEWALFDLTREINEIAMATLKSVTLSTMLMQIEKRKRAQRDTEAGSDVRAAMQAVDSVAGA